jgi:hypothetical protein
MATAARNVRTKRKRIEARYNRRVAAIHSNRRGKTPHSGVWTSGKD